MKLNSLVRIKVVSASCADLLSRLSNHGIHLKDINFEDSITVAFSVSRRSYYATKQLLKKYNTQVKIVHKSGLYWTFKGLLHRPILLIGVFLITFLALYLPSRVLFVAVEGNIQISEETILEAARVSGIYCGVSRRMIRSEKLKNELLSAIPQLQWAGVNTYGCLAVISVEEKVAEKSEEITFYQGSVVAGCDGVITQMSVLSGTPQVKVGQAVIKGQTLVSGYADYGFKLKATGANAEIIADTGRVLRLYTLTTYTQRDSLINTKRRISFFLGKKVINLCKGSGISDPNCVRMYLEYYLVLPGGLKLPAGIQQEVCQYYHLSSQANTTADDYDWLYDQATDYLKQTMVAGEITQRNEELTILDGYCSLYGTYRCSEMISRIRYEEIVQKHE